MKRPSEGPIRRGMSSSQLFNELKNHILSYLVNVEHHDSRVIVTHDYGVDGEQYIQFQL